MVRPESIDGGGTPEQAALIVDETRLNRQQVLERYLTATDRVTGERGQDFLINLGGYGESALLCPTSSMIMPQIRDSYDAYHIEGLGRHICTSEDGQLQNGGVAVVDEDHVKQYVDDLNQFFMSDINLGGIPYSDTLGGYVMTMFGHNRQLGIASYNRAHNGHPDHGHPFYAKVVRNPEFWRVIGMQAAENTGLSPKMWDRSRAIVQYKQLRTRDGVPPTQQEIAATFGVDTDQVWRAERYEALPAEIKKLVVDEKLVYSGSFELDGLFGLYDEESVIALARQLSEKRASTAQIIDQVKLRTIVANLSPEIYLMVEDGAITLPQAKELDKLRAAGGTTKRINDIASWIGLNRPKILEVRQKVDGEVKALNLGMDSMLGDQPGVPYDEQERADLRAGNARRRLADGAMRAAEHVASIHATLDSGLVGTEAAQDLPVTTAVRQFLGKVIAKEQAGEPTGLDPAVFEQLDALVAKEQALANGEEDNTRRSEVAARLAERLKATPQESLF